MDGLVGQWGSCVWVLDSIWPKKKGLAMLLVFAFYLAWHFIYAAWSFRCVQYPALMGYIGWLRTVGNFRSNIFFNLKIIITNY